MVIDHNALLKNLPTSTKTYRCHGISMLPLFFEGMIVLVHKPNSIFLGDIVVFKQHNTTIMHRVIAIDSKSQTYLCKGDNEPTPDGWISKVDILGIASHAIYHKHIKPLTTNIIKTYSLAMVILWLAEKRIPKLHKIRIYIFLNPIIQRILRNTFFGITI